MTERIQLRRRHIGPDSTFGELYGPDGSFWAHTLEDPVRNVKVAGKTAIPAGTFEVVVAWSPKYQRQMPRLLSVPFFEGVLIHPGNDVADTEGCILVGDDDPRTPAFLDRSRVAFDRLFPLIRNLAGKGQLLIDIEGGFEAQHWVRGAA